MNKIIDFDRTTLSSIDLKNNNITFLSKFVVVDTFFRMFLKNISDSNLVCLLVSRFLSCYLL